MRVRAQSVPQHLVKMGQNMVTYRDNLQSSRYLLLYYNMCINTLSGLFTVSYGQTCLYPALLDRSITASITTRTSDSVFHASVRAFTKV